MSHKKTAVVLRDRKPHILSKLTEFGFETCESFACRRGTKLDGVLVLDDMEIPVEFRVRDHSPTKNVCSFANISISHKEMIAKYLRNLETVADGNEDLANMSYDQLAKGITRSEASVPSMPAVSSNDTDDLPVSESPAPANPTTQIPVAAPMAAPTTATTIDDPVADPTPQPAVSATTPASVAANNDNGQESNKFAKTVALLAMLAAMVALAILTVGFLKSRSSLSVSNSALVGNYLPINAQVAGSVKGVYVKDGDFVEAGQVLMELENKVLELQSEQYRTEMVAANATVAAIQKQLESFEKKLSVVTEKLNLDLAVAKSELEVAQKSKQIASSVVKRMQPYVKTGAISDLEFSEAENAMQGAEAQCLAKENLMRQIEFSQKAAKSNVLLLGDRFDDEIGRIESELAIAQAEYLRARKMFELTESQLGQLKIVTPRAGQVYATYRQVGEFLKLADEAVAISYPGKTWASGHVTALQASRVRPGQPVKVNVPSLNLKLEGVVSAVGHRSVYSKGGYNAEFRGTTATDVPVKVVLNRMPEDGIPVGMRLDMSISTGFGVDWLDNSFGYELKSVSDQDSRKKSDGPAPEVEDLKPEINQQVAERQNPTVK